jgi:hypothetical protein
VPVDGHRRLVRDLAGPAAAVVDGRHPHAPEHSRPTHLPRQVVLERRVCGGRRELIDGSVIFLELRRCCAVVLNRRRRCEVGYLGGSRRCPSCEAWWRWRWRCGSWWSPSWSGTRGGVSWPRRARREAVTRRPRHRRAAGAPGVGRRGPMCS